MYSAIWRLIPGPMWLRILISTVVVGAIIAALMIYVFPWVDTLMTSQNSQVG